MLPQDCTVAISYSFCLQVNKELLHRLAGDLVQACIGAPAAASQCWVAPALRALANLAKLPSAQQLLGAPQQELLLPVLEGLQRQPEVCARAGRLILLGKAGLAG